MIDNKNPFERTSSLEETFEVVAETAIFTTKDAVSGRVRVRSTTELVEEHIAGTLSASKIEVNRVPVDKMVDGIPETRVEGDVTIIPVVEERFVIERRLFVTEELHIKRVATSEAISVPVTLRRQRATIERLSTEPSQPNHLETLSRREPMSLDTHAARNEFITAFFDNRSDAEAAAERIAAQGVSRHEIKIVSGADTSATSVSGQPVEEKGFFESIGDFFMPDEDRHAYAEGLRRGGYLVTVPTTMANRDRVLDILDDEGTVDMDEREESWRSEGWSGVETGYDDRQTVGSDAIVPVGGTYAAGSTAGDVSGRAADHDGTLDVVAERLRVGKRDVSHGRVKVRSYVAEDDVSEDVSLRSENVEISRRAVDRPVESFDGAFKDRTIELEETSQEAIISKEARVVEEIDLSRTVRDRTETVSDTVRRTEVEIEDDRVAGDKTLSNEERNRRGL